MLTVLLPSIERILLVDMEVIKWAFLIGYASHLFADALTSEGIPLLFPFQKMYAFSPVKFMRIRTGGIREKWIIFPGLLLLNGYLLYSKYPVYISFFKTILNTK